MPAASLPVFVPPGPADVPPLPEPPEPCASAAPVATTIAKANAAIVFIRIAPLRNVERCKLSVLRKGCWNRIRKRGGRSTHIGKERTLRQCKRVSGRCPLTLVTYACHPSRRRALAPARRLCRQLHYDPSSPGRRGETTRNLAMDRQQSIAEIVSAFTDIVCERPAGRTAEASSVEVGCWLTDGRSRTCEPRKLKSVPAQGTHRPPRCHGLVVKSMITYRHRW
jgi:hypothetical protein